MSARGAGASNGRARRVGVVAREEFRRAFEVRWMFGFTALLTALMLGLSYFGLAQAHEVGFQGFDRVTLSLMNLVLVIVPLTGLTLGVASVTGGTGSLALLLAQPVSRGEVLLGKFVGLAGALSVSLALAFGAGGTLIAMNAGAQQAGSFLVLTAITIALGWLMVATALCIAVLWPDRLRAMSAALGLWLLMVIAYDLVVLGATAALHGVPLQAILFPSLILNPVDLARVLVMLSLGSGALFGPTAAVLANAFGTGPGIALGLAVLFVEAAVPLLVAAAAFRRRDW